MQKEIPSDSLKHFLYIVAKCKIGNNEGDDGVILHNNLSEIKMKSGLYGDFRIFLSERTATDGNGKTNILLETKKYDKVTS